MHRSHSVLALIHALSGLALVACAPLTQTVDEKTGTTVAHRCAARALALTQFRAQPEFAVSSNMQRVARAYEGYTRLICPPPWGLAVSLAPAPDPVESVEPARSAPAVPRSE